MAPDLYCLKKVWHDQTRVFGTPARNTERNCLGVQENNSSVAKETEYERHPVKNQITL